MPHECVFKTDQVAVTDSAVALFDTMCNEGREYYGYIKNTGAECVYIGNGNVTAECGYELDSREELPIKFFDNTDTMKAICK